MELSEKLQQAKQSVSSYTSAIESMKAQRDTTLSDIERFQLGLDVGFATYQFAAYILYSVSKKTGPVLCFEITPTNFAQ